MKGRFHAELRAQSGLPSEAAEARRIPYNAIVGSAGLLAGCWS